jgi:hypothetical protein
MYFLLKANYKPIEWYDGLRQVPIPAGSFITSYATAATECSLSVQQIRDAFAHLERTQFATYRRTHRWTLVTVVNWAAYQAIADEENTVENTNSTRQGTPDKEIKKKRTNTCASPGGDARAYDPSPENTTEPIEAGAPLPSGPDPRAAAQDLAAKQEAWFSHWWPAYWLRKAKQAARRAFGKHVRTEERFQEIIAATRAQAPGMLAKEERFRPHGATWLNEQRWEDEPGDTALRQEASGSTYVKWEPPTETGNDR